MSDVFVSYSRRDAEFVRGLADDLRSRGKDVWVDDGGIRDAENFPDALRTAIQGSDAFVFVISPDSVVSEFCELEIVQAVALNKRIVPVALREVTDAQIPEEIRFRNWIPVSEGMPPTDRVVTAIETDLAWEQRHTRITVKALEWQREERDGSFLLRGSDLATAEAWLSEGAGKDPGPTELEQEYIFAGRSAASRRQRTLVIGSIGVSVVALALLVFALISRGQAVTAKAHAVRVATTAKSQALAADSATQLQVDPELSLLLGIHAVQTAATTQAMFSLRAALDASPIRARLPAVPSPPCATGHRSDATQSYPLGPGIAYSPDGRELAEGLCTQHEVRIANVATGAIEHTFHFTGPAEFLAYVSAHELVVDAAGRLEAIDPNTGRVIRRGPRVAAKGTPATDPRAPIIAFPEYTDVALWNTRTGAIRRLPIPHSATSYSLQVAFSPSGSRIAVASAALSAPSPPGVIMLRTATGRMLAHTAVTIDNGFPGLTATGVAFSPNGLEVVAAETDLGTGKGTIALLDSRTLRRLRTLRTDGASPASAVAFSADGTRVADAFADGSGGVVSTSGRPLVAFPGITAAPWFVAFSPTGGVAAESTSDGEVRLWEATGLALTTIPEPGIPAATVFSPAASGVSTLYVTGSGAFVRRWRSDGAPKAPPLPVYRGGVASLGAAVLSADGRFAAVQVDDPRNLLHPESIRIWDIAQRRVTRVLPATIPPDAATQFFAVPIFLAGDRTLATAVAAPHGAVRDELIDVRTGHVRTLQTRACGEPGGPNAIARSASGRLVAFAHSCGAVQVFNTSTGRPVGTPLTAGNPYAIAISPNGQLLAAAGNSGTVIVKDIATGDTVATLSQDLQAVRTLAFSPDGHYLAAGGDDHTIRIWDAHTWNQLHVITAHNVVFQIAFTPDSQQIDSVDYDTDLQTWDACTDCENPPALLTLARSRVTRPLTPGERREFTVGG